MLRMHFSSRSTVRICGVSDVSLFRAVPGGLTQGFTGVKRDYRRRGIATG